MIHAISVVVCILLACGCCLTGCKSEETNDDLSTGNAQPSVHNRKSSTDSDMQTLSVGMELEQALSVLKNNMVEVEDTGLGAVRISDRDRWVQYVAKPIYESDDALVLLAKEDGETGRHTIRSMYWHIKYEEDFNLPKAHRGERYLDVQSVDTRVLLPSDNRVEPGRRSDYDPFE